MPVVTHIDPEARLRKHAISGPLTVQVLQDALTDVYADQAYDPTMAALWDLREATIDLSPDEVRKIADFVAPRWGGGRAAIVVANEHAFGMARMYELLLSEQARGDVMVFRSIADAAAWLEAEVPPDVPPP